MEQTLGYIVFGAGWPVLIAGSIWAWRRGSGLTGHARTFLNVALVSFYVLGYTCTMYWRGQSWIIGVLPAFVAFLVLLVVTLRAVAALRAA